MSSRQNFTKTTAYAKLEKLKAKPHDLTAEGGLTPERIARYAVEGAGVKLLYATERVNDEILETLYALAEEAQAIPQMRQMQEGEIVNFIDGYESENRPALHTAMRDLFDAPQTAQPARAAADLMKQELEKLKNFLKSIEGKFTDIIQIGIGGSELGPKAVYLALEAFHQKGKRVHFLANVDPDETAAILSAVDLAKTLVVVVSKSGSTLETLTNESLIRDALRRRNLQAKDHMVAVTGKGSPMDDPSHYRASFYMWDFIGGRYSASSMVGGVTLAFALGFAHFLDFLKGAHAMDRVAYSAKVEENVPLIGALLGIWNRNFLGCETSAVIPYAHGLSRLPAHLQQLDMESNGKRVMKDGHTAQFHTGPIIWGEPGTNGQHSFFQSIHQGTTVVPLEIIGFSEGQYTLDLDVQGTTSREKLLSNLFAQALALAQGKRDANPNRFFPGNRPSRILLMKRLDPHAMGALLAYFEHKVAFQGFIWGINSFDQEGVQLGKKLATQFLDTYQAEHEGKRANFPLGEAFLKHLP